MPKRTRRKKRTRKMKKKAGSSVMSISEALGTIGLDQNTHDFKVVKKAYRTLARKLHPDKGGDKDKFQMIQNAFERLEYEYENEYSHWFDKEESPKSRTSEDSVYSDDEYAHVQRLLDMLKRSGGMDRSMLNTNETMLRRAKSHHPEIDFSKLELYQALELVVEALEQNMADKKKADEELEAKRKVHRKKRYDQERERLRREAREKMKAEMIEQIKKELKEAKMNRFKEFVLGEDSDNYQFGDISKGLWRKAKQKAKKVQEQAQEKMRGQTRKRTKRRTRKKRRN